MSLQKIILLGATGQLGREVRLQAPGDISLMAYDSSQLDVTDSDRVENILQTENPGIIINCSAYTAVDQAEQDVDRAFAVNADGPKNLALSASPETFIIHISTDFIFDGLGHRPYRVEDEPAPIGIYGKSKLRGETGLMAKHNTNSAIIRTSWLYSAKGKNFVNTMLGLMRSRDTISVVSDQHGSPTSVRSLAEVIWSLVRSPASGLFHWSDAGETTWYDFACEIQRQALDIGLLGKAIDIRPVSSEEYPTPARRPAYSVLDSSKLARHLGIMPAPWQLELGAELHKLHQSGEIDSP